MDRGGTRKKTLAGGYRKGAYFQEYTSTSPDPQHGGGSVLRVPPLCGYSITLSSLGKGFLFFSNIGPKTALPVPR